MSVFVTINRSRDSEYHTQRNNKEIPFSSCNTTAYVMAAKQAGIEITAVPDGTQPEDYFTRHMLTEAKFDEMARRFPWSYVDKGKDGFEWLYKPNMIHEMLAEGFNELVGYKAANFDTHRSLETLAGAIVAGNGVVLSGKFPYRGGVLNHIVSLAGFVTSQADVEQKRVSVDTGQITEWIIDDSFGNPLTDYTDHCGNNVHLTREQFNGWLKRQGDVNAKWAHIIRGR